MTTITPVNVWSAPDDNTGDLWRDGFIKINTNIDNLNNDKVEVEPWKGLSTEDYTTSEKNKLWLIEDEATKNDTDANLRDQLTHTGINHWIINPLSDIITINGWDDKLYDLAAFDYFINWVKYSFGWLTAQDPWFLLWEQALFLYVWASWIETQKNLWYNLTQLDNTLVFGSVNAPNSVNINIVWNNPYYIDTEQKREYIRSTTAEWPIFYQNCAKITENISVDRQIDLAGWDYNSWNKEVSSFTAVQNAVVVNVFHVSWQWNIQAPWILTVDNLQYDNWTDLVTAGDNMYLAHDLFISERTNTILLVYSQNQYDSLNKALQAPISQWPLAWLPAQGIYPIGKVALKKWDTNITSIKDYRTTDIFPIGIDNTPITDGVVNLSPLANGSIINTTSIVVNSPDAWLTTQLTVEKNWGWDIEIQLSEKNYIYDTTPPAWITLTNWTDTDPIENYIFIENQSWTLTLVANTTGFPTTEYAPVATVLCQSATSIDTDWAYKIHNWVDHMEEEGNNWHLSHINKWIRNQSATILSWMDTTTTPVVGWGTASTTDVAVSAWTALQLHWHATPDYNTATWTDIYVSNHPTTKYLKVNDLDILIDSEWTSLSWDRYNLVLWQAVNDETNESKLFMNLPTWSYWNNSQAIADRDNTANYTIPSDFTWTWVVVARITIRHRTAWWGTYEILNIDERPALWGGWTSWSATEFDQWVFRVFSTWDDTKKIALNADNITTSNTRTLTVQDKDWTIATTWDNVSQFTNDAWYATSAADIWLWNVDNTSDANKPVSTATQAALDTKEDKTTSINAQTGTTYTLVLTDQSKLVTLTNASAITLTVPTNASVALPIWTQVDLSQDGAGAVTIGWAWVTINSLWGLLTSNWQYVWLTLIKVWTDEWNLYGNLA